MLCQGREENGAAKGVGSGEGPCAGAGGEGPAVSLEKVRAG